MYGRMCNKYIYYLCYIYVEPGFGFAADGAFTFTRERRRKERTTCVPFLCFRHSEVIDCLPVPQHIIVYYWRVLPTYLIPW